MAGRINEEDIAAVRDRARIDEIVGSYVTLRRSGSSMVGLCPFHEEKTPSFQVTPARGLWYCFGACSEGGDVISFVQKIDNLSFVESIERLADRVGIQLRYTDDGGPRTPPGLRMRLMEMHQAAAEYFTDQLTKPDALAGRQFLAERGFDRETATDFGVGFAPRDGKSLLRHLRGRGFADADLVAGGLARESGYDFFQGRLLWPIRDSGRQVLGFGGRRIFDDDRISAKYINTPETQLYKKSHVLYGLDRARQAIAKKSQAVVVEGYTDVMAAHLSGVDTAIASCGTAFGDDHARLLRRLMGDHDAFNGEVIFTFDGDEAGQSAALKVFSGDQNFLAQTYVAVEPSGLDPCDLRLQQGDAAVRELVARRVPLYRFVMSNIISRHDLDRADGRLNALRSAAPLVGSIRDRGLVSGYIRELTGLLGMEPDEVQREVARAARAPRPQSKGDRSKGDRGRGYDDNHSRDDAAAGQPPADQAPERRPAGPELPDPNDRLLTTERQTLKLIIQAPQRFGAGWDGVGVADFTHPAYAAVFTGVEKAAADGTEGDWAHRVSLAAEDERIRSLVVSLAVEPLPITGDPTERLVSAYSSSLQLLTVMRQIAELKSKLQRTNPVDHATRYNQMFSELVVLEARRHALHQRSMGSQES